MEETKQVQIQGKRRILRYIPHLVGSEGEKGFVIEESEGPNIRFFIKFVDDKEHAESQRKKRNLLMSRNVPTHEVFELIQTTDGRYLIMMPDYTEGGTRTAVTCNDNILCEDTFRKHLEEFEAAPINEELLRIVQSISTPGTNDVVLLLNQNAYMIHYDNRSNLQLMVLDLGVEVEEMRFADEPNIQAYNLFFASYFFAWVFERPFHIPEEHALSRYAASVRELSEVIISGKRSLIEQHKHEIEGGQNVRDFSFPDDIGRQIHASIERILQVDKEVN